MNTAKHSCGVNFSFGHFLQRPVFARNSTLFVIDEHGETLAMANSVLFRAITILSLSKKVGLFRVVNSNFC